MGNRLGGPKEIGGSAARQATAVQLTVAGSFQVIHHGVQVDLAYDPHSAYEPWCLSAIDRDGLCRRSCNFADLDAGLLALAEWGAVARLGPRRLFRLDLPSGDSVLRPGAVSTGALLLRYGYHLVGTVRAFLVAEFDPAAPPQEVTDWFKNKLGILGPLLGTVDLADDINGQSCWCGDVMLPANGFYRTDGLLQFAQNCVGSTGIEMFSEIMADDDGDTVPTWAPPAAVIPFSQAGAV